MYLPIADCCFSFVPVNLDIIPIGYFSDLSPPPKELFTSEGESATNKIIIVIYLHFIKQFTILLNSEKLPK